MFTRMRINKFEYCFKLQVTQTLYNPPSKCNLLPMLSGHLIDNHHSLMLEANTKGCELLEVLNVYENAD